MTIGRASTSRIAAAGITTSPMSRNPIANWARRPSKSPRLGAARGLRREGRHDRHREQAVRELEERERGQVDGRVADVPVREEQRHPERELVRGDVADRPAGEPGELAHGRVPPLPDPVEPDPGVPDRGPSTRAIATMPAVVPSPRSSTSAGSWRTLVTVGGSLAILGSASSAAITTTLFRTGANAAAAKRRRALSIAVASAVTP